jgi:hypothetical protein
MLKTKEILKDLASCEPYKPAKGPFMVRSGKLSWLLLGLGGLCLCMLVVFGFWYKKAPSTLLAYTAFSFYILTMLLGAFSLLVEPIVGFMLMRRWKVETLNTITHEIANDETHVRRLMRYDDNTLKYVQHWLQLKVKRLDARIVLFFGGSTAVYTLFALTLSNIKDAGGLPWLHQTLASGFAPGNLVNTLTLWGIALVFGVSVGAMLMKVVQGRYTYHLELVELSMMRKSLEAEGKSETRHGRITTQHESTQVS